MKFVCVLVVLVLVRTARNGDAPNKISNNLVVVKIDDPGVDVSEVAGRYDLTVVSKVFPDESYFIFKSEVSAISDVVIEELNLDDQITQVLPQFLHDRKGRTYKESKIRYDKGGDIPEINIDHYLYHRVNISYNGSDGVYFNDPFFSDQWYLKNYGQTGSKIGNDVNVVPVWKAGFSGHGIILSVLDDGIQARNDEIRENFDSGVSFDYIDNEADQDETPLDNSHGTYCAAIIAAEANNNNCGVGIAYNAKVGGTRLIDGPVTDVQEALALTHALDKIDVFSASWGPSDDGKNVDGPSILTKRAFIKGVTQGRGGKGVIYVWAGGNGAENSDNCNLDGYASNIHSLSIGALTAEGQNAFYSEPCASIFASTFIGGSHVVPNIRGQCIESFQGTSAAAPMAAGIIALMLEANAFLTWRDVQHIVARTSRISSVLPVPYGWFMNKAGFFFNLYQGFGVMDAASMVSLAQNWKNVGPQIEIKEKFTDVPKEFSSGHKVQLYAKINLQTYPSDRKIHRLEHVLVTLSIQHPRRGTLELFLVSPAGTVSTLLTRRSQDKSPNGFNNWTFTSVHFWGETPSGVWKLVLHDHSKRDDKIRELTDCEISLLGTNGEDPNQNVPLLGGLPRKLNTSEIRYIFETQKSKSENVYVKKRKYER
ncbi:PC3-like endoprotease variant B [Nymphon striatum]|nr:PC3-like endoprotease variant B [Nymphon striatum]